MRKVYLLFFVFFFATTTQAQDFNCRVQVLFDRVSTTNTQIFKNLEISVTEFFNSRKWKKETVGNEERIDLNIIINIGSYNNTDAFSGELQIRATRPVFGSSYNSVLLTHQDEDFAFTYINFQPMDFNENSYSNNLVSLLGFYAYIVLGMDGDSFSPEGGSSYYNSANNTLLAAQSANAPGWQSTDGKNNRNRFWLMENLLNDRFKGMRQAMYTYHRKGLDMMYKDLETGRNEITNALKEMQKVAKVVPNSYLMRIFFNSKADEIVAIYGKALATDKNRIIEILKEVDPANITKWESIRK